MPSPAAFQEHPRERIVDQRILTLGVGRAGRRHTQRRGAHALGDLPAVVISSRHVHFLPLRSTPPAEGTQRFL